VADTAATELVVVAAGAARATQRGEGLQAEGVDEPIVVHMRAMTTFFLPD
jgi:hypothetical protein